MKKFQTAEPVDETAEGTVRQGLTRRQIAAISGAAYAAPVGTYPAKTITFSLGLAIAAGSSQTFALSVLLGAGTVDDGTVLSWDTSVKILGSYQVGSEKTSDLSWVGTSA
ncbi:MULTISPECIES: hypothetical protein [Subtercola]|uniref:Head decoration protein n=1 Tax=Subtercola vilae TaxID=2056433 RepID=A0A4T2C3T7_9MICO|nr:MULTISPECIES: hypothetical protein [Subtercola]MEA9985073.1 hypothetical protein [Subtercola sp. RTI3]TIH37096.1 hypothetical protein D4765_08720 [Subtercola vilae]